MRPSKKFLDESLIKRILVEAKQILSEIGMEGAPSDLMDDSGDFGDPEVGALDDLGMEDVGMEEPIMESDVEVTPAFEPVKRNVFAGRTSTFGAPFYASPGKRRGWVR